MNSRTAHFHTGANIRKKGTEGTMKFYGGRNFDRFENRWKHLSDRGEGGVCRSRESSNGIPFSSIPFISYICISPMETQTNFFPAGRAPRKSNLVIRRDPRDVSLIARKVSLIVSYPLN